MQTLSMPQWDDFILPKKSNQNIVRAYNDYSFNNKKK